MGAEVLIREMVASDLTTVTEIDEALFGAQRFPTWPFSFEVYRSEYRPDISLVAEIGGKVVGFVVGCLVLEEHSRSVLSLRHSEPRPYAQVGWIDMIGVSPVSQHSGVGRELVEAFCHRCSSLNVAIRAVASDGDVRLRKFLEGAGFAARDFVIYERDAGTLRDGAVN